MRSYELSYLLSPEIKTEEIKKLIQEINSFIQNEGGNIVKSENPTPKTLAYSIKKQEAAFWGNLDFDLNPEKIEELRKKLQKENKILRFLLSSKKLPKKKFTKDEVSTAEPTLVKASTKEEKKSEKKVELKEIEKKIDEILSE